MCQRTDPNQAKNLAFLLSEAQKLPQTPLKPIYGGGSPPRRASARRATLAHVVHTIDKHVGRANNKPDEIQ